MKWIAIKDKMLNLIPFLLLLIPFTVQSMDKPPQAELPPRPTPIAGPLDAQHHTHPFWSSKMKIAVIGGGSAILSALITTGIAIAIVEVKCKPVACSNSTESDS